MNATTRTTLPDLRLDQGAITEVLEKAPGADRTRKQKWYGTLTGITPDHLDWGRTAHEQRYGHAIVECTVYLPSITVGTIEELNDDIRAALNRHATKHGF